MNYIRSTIQGLAAALILFGGATTASAVVVLMDQDYENPVGYINNGQDVTGQTVNTLYANQPAGFLYAQTFTVETLAVTGGLSFGGSGYKDPGGTAGNFMIGMLSGAQDDRLGLNFNVGTANFLNVGIDLTSIDLTCCGGFFVPVGTSAAIPIFHFSLFDNPTGVVTIGGGTLLDTFDATATASARDVVDFTNSVFGLDASASVNGNVTLQIDLLQGGYAAFDNLRITAADVEGNLGAVPVPAAVWLFGTALIGLVGFGKRKARIAA